MGIFINLAGENIYCKNSLGEQNIVQGKLIW